MFWKYSSIIQANMCVDVKNDTNLRELLITERIQLVERKSLFE